MARDPRSRDELRRHLTELLGAEAAETLMEALPPHPWDELVTKADLALLRTDLFGELDGFRSEVRAEFQRFDERMTARIEMSEHKLTAAFRGELNTAITSQTRSLIYSNLGITVTLAATFLAALKLA